ncbi:MAG TPA: ribonuclease HIII [Candidatus Cloacimonadota bacterium]|nr:ribonuclease HIII [Candidatus Cloacimonadota bacterium]
MKAIEPIVADILGKLAQCGIQVYEQVPLQYGLQLRLIHEDEKAVLNIYHSAKKGISLVIGGKTNTQIRRMLQEIVGEQVSQQILQVPESKHSWSDWIGSDESGKGDYFGPLVVCSFRANREVEKRLWAMGVMDSKLLQDREIKDLAQRLYRDFPGLMNGLVLMPKTYNRIIEDMRKQGRNLNDLLAWQHFKVLEEMLSADDAPDGVLVDQFTSRKTLSQLFQAKEIDINLVERPRSESDAAVAAASVLARFQYISAMAEMSRKFNMGFALGAGAKVDKVGREFVQKYGTERLNEVAKLHFKNTTRVC